MRLPLTAHAARRMAERDITMPMIRACLAHGEHRPGSQPGTASLHLCGLRVVVGLAGTIITVSAHRPHPSRPGPKRLARMLGQERRRYEREARRSGSRGW